MSKLSSWLTVHAGIPKGVQQAVSAPIAKLPGVSVVTGVAGTLEGLFGNPFKGVVAPGTDPLSKALGLGPGGVLDVGQGGRAPRDANGRCPSGYHLNRHRLNAGKRVAAAEPFTVCVRNRSMNPANGRALNRAARRLRRGERTLRHVLTVQGKHAGKIKPKSRKR